jgi:hypothetical protein
MHRPAQLQHLPLCRPGRRQRQQRAGQGTVTEINSGSSVDMTNPTTQGLHRRGKANYPAKRCWCYGITGGGTPADPDETSGGSNLMSLEHQDRLTGSGIDMVDFACVSWRLETLAKLEGLANFAVFSEEVVPGEGNPYTSIIDGIQANPTQDARTLSGMIVDRFNASFAGNKSSTTLSAYDMAGFAAFETALNSLAADLQAGLAGGLTATISAAAAGSQKYTISELTEW